MSIDSLEDYAVLDPRATLVLAEWLSPAGLSAAAHELLARRAGWSARQIELLHSGFCAYWRRAGALAARAAYLPAPRVRNVAVVHAPETVRPFCQILNASTWTLYACDLDPDTSNGELVSYLLLQGDRQAQVGEVTLAPVHLAPYWFERSAAECDAFAAAARASNRPDGDALRATAAALPWLRQLRHGSLRPPRKPTGHREIPGTGILVPRAFEEAPNGLLAATRASASAALQTFYDRWRAPDEPVRSALLDWLAGTAPPLIVATRHERVVWSPDAPGEIDALRDELADAGRAALLDIRADLEVVADRTRRFHDALTRPADLPPPDPALAQSGYAYLHRERGLLAYNLHEPGIERLRGPAIPYARAMLGARSMHEWAHLAADAGWVPLRVSSGEWDERCARLTARFDEVIARAPRVVRRATDEDLLALGRRDRPGAALTGVVTGRMPDFQSNLVAARLLDLAERETYVRQNIRPLRPELPPARLWTMLARALYEFQYLRFSLSPAPRHLFLHSTWFADDFLASGALREDDLDALLTAVGELCTAYAIDESCFRFPA